MTTFQAHRPWIRSRGNDVDAWPRYVTATTGAWLFLSAFLWKHQPLQGTNAWIVGALVFVAAMCAIALPRARFANTALAVWLLISATCFGAFSYTTFNNVVAAAIVFVFSLIPNGRGGPLVPPRRTPDTGERLDRP